MKAFFRKSIQLYEAIAYLTLEKEQERPDIVEFLNGKRFENEIINQRVTEYLKQIGIYDEQGNLTKKGKIVRETGKIFVREEGKYKIWYSEYTSGRTILYYRRETPRREKAAISEVSPDKFAKENYFLPLQPDSTFSYVKLARNAEILLDRDSSSIAGKLSLIWEWEGLEKSYYTFEGEINKKDIQPHSIPVKADLEEVLIEYIPAFPALFGFEYEWNDKYKRLEVPFSDNMEQEVDLKNFLIKEKSLNDINSWQDIRFENIPVMPKSLDDAESWKAYLITKELEKRYFSEYDFQKLADEINQKEGFSAYQNDLKRKIPIREFSRSLFKQRQKQTPAFWHLTAPTFWHLTAPMDLNPDINIKTPKTKISFGSGEEITLREIAEELKSNTSHSVNTVFYYDKFVKNKWQQKAMLAFFEAMEAERNYLITDTQQSPREDLIRNSGIVEEIDLRQVFKKIKPHHNRYIILAKDKEEYTIWQLPNSIDYIRFEEVDSISPDAVGTLKGEGISFIQEERRILNPVFIKFIEEKL